MEKQNDTLSIQITIDLKASIEQVWKYLTMDINQWWRKDFYSSPKTKRMVLETKVSGRMYEDYGNEEGLLWYNVIVLDSPNTLELKGPLTPSFGGPAITFLKLDLQQNENICQLTLTDTVFGVLKKDSKKDIEEGWKLLFDESFKAYVNAKSHLG